MRNRDRIRDFVGCTISRRTGRGNSSSGSTTLGLILWSYGFMALGRGRWLRDSRSSEEPENSPWCWWNAGRANRGRPACASFPCIPYSPSRPSAFSHPRGSLFLSFSFSLSSLDSSLLSSLSRFFVLSHERAALAPHLDVSSHSSLVSLSFSLIL